MLGVLLAKAFGYSDPHTHIVDPVLTLEYKVWALELTENLMSWEKAGEER